LSPNNQHGGVLIKISWSWWSISSACA